MYLTIIWDVTFRSITKQQERHKRNDTCSNLNTNYSRWVGTFFGLKCKFIPFDGSKETNQEGV